MKVEFEERKTWVILNWPTSMQIDRLLRPRSIAIIGASANPVSPGARVLGNLARFDFQGPIHLVNPTRSELEGRACVANVDDLPKGVDLAVLCVPKNATVAALQACARRNVGGAVVFAAGFAEQDEEGVAEQVRLAAIATEAGMAMLGPNCLGMVNINGRAPITIAKVNPPDPSSRRVLGVVSQSGAFMSAIRTTLEPKGVSCTFSISVGNQAVLGTEDFLAELINDEATRVIAVYAERLRQPKRFLELAAIARAQCKPIILYHPGRSNLARAAAQSHTGALATNYETMRALTRHDAVLLVDSIDELTDVAALLCRYHEPPTKGVGVVTNSGAFRGITFDVCEAAGLEVAKPLSATVEALRGRLPPFAVLDNPLDLTVQTVAEPELVGLAAKALVDDPQIGSVVLAIHSGPEGPEYPKRAAPLIRNSAKPIAYAVVGDGALMSEEFLEGIRDAKVVLIRSVERALRAMAHITHYGQALAAGSQREPSVERTRAPLRVGALPEHEGKALLAAAGIAVPKGALARTIGEAQAIAAKIGFPVVIKAQASELKHKSDVGGVLVGIRDVPSLREGWEVLHSNVGRAAPGVRLDGVLVERLAPPGVELVVGARRDPDWGPVLLVGLGGIWIEVFKDVRLMPADLGLGPILDEIGKLRGAKLLQGARGANRADIRAVAHVVAAVGRMMRSMVEIREIDINPLVVYPEGDGILALDALIVTDAAAS